MRTYQKNGRWYLEGMIRKKRFHKSIPEAVTKKDAENYMNIFKADLLRGKLDLVEDIGCTQLKEVIDLYIKYAYANLRSIDTAERIAKRFSEIWGNKQLKDITPKEIEKYKLTRSKTIWHTKIDNGNEIPQYISAATINRELNVLSKIFSIAVSNGMLRENPLKHVKKLPVKNKIERHLTPEEELRMYKVCDNNFSFLDITEEAQNKLKIKCANKYSYLKPILTIALNTGMRKSEILNLTWDCINFETNEITVLCTKNSKKNIIPMNHKVKTVLSEKYKSEYQNKFVFTNPETANKYVDFKKAFKTVCKLANVDKLRFHDLRHTAGTRMASCNIPLPTVKEILNHASINTTMRYVHTMREQKEEALELLSNFVYRGNILD